MRPLWLLAFALLSACSATGKLAITPVDIRPVTQMKSEPFDPAETRQLADESFSLENYTGALKEYSRLMSYDPDDRSAKLGAGESLLALGEYDRAAHLFWADEFPDLNDDDDERLEIGRILSGIYTQRYETPEPAIHDGFLIRPKDARLWNAKGQGHDRKGEWMDALFSYVTALDTGKWQSGTINNMGMSLLLQGRYVQAREKFEQAIELSPDTQIYDNNLRMAFILLGDFRPALQDIDESRASDIFNDAGYVAMKSGRPVLAEQFFTKALEISPVHHAKAQANLDTLSANDQAP